VHERVLHGADRRGTGGGRGGVPLLLLWLVAGAALAQVSEDWADSPEAYFLTREERAEWKQLDSGLARDRFRESYWLKRDPTPGSEKNEFYNTVLARIKTADARFPIEKTPGSRTKRGFVFVVFGTPARVNETRTPPLEPPRPPQAGGAPRNPVGVVEGNETTSVWIYDRERTPRLLEALGNRPSLEVTFVIEPTRRRDSIQNPGLVDEYRDTLAKKSIVNPDVIPPAAADASPPPGRPALPQAVLSPAIRASLEKAPSAARSENGSVFGSAVLWGKAGDPETFVWFFLPAGADDLTLNGWIRSKDGTEVAAVSEPAAASPFFSTSRPDGRVVLRRFALPPGTYNASFAVEGKETRASCAATLQVPALEGAFAVSSLILSAGAGRAEPTPSTLFVFGESQVPPRADAVFLTSESLWYFLEVATPSDPAKVTLETRLRRGTEEVGSSGAFPAGLVEIAPGRYICGTEMPLATLERGDYVLYVTVRTGGDQRPSVRRGDFQLLPSGPGKQGSRQDADPT